MGSSWPLPPSWSQLWASVRPSSLGVPAWPVRCASSSALCLWLLKVKFLGVIQGLPLCYRHTLWAAFPPSRWHYAVKTENSVIPNTHDHTPSAEPRGSFLRLGLQFLLHSGDGDLRDPESHVPCKSGVPAPPMADLVDLSGDTTACDTCVSQLYKWSRKRWPCWVSSRSPTLRGGLRFPVTTAHLVEGTPHLAYPQKIGFRLAAGLATSCKWNTFVVFTAFSHLLKAGWLPVQTRLYSWSFAGI